jgi:large subunit ribosomal protein L22
MEHRKHKNSNHPYVPSTTNMKQATANLRYLRMAPRKVRLMASVLAGMSANEAEAQLVMRPQRAAGPLLKLLRSAVANAREMKLDIGKLSISSIRVDQGPMLKRFLPRARGSASPIQKKMSHVMIILEESEKAVLKRFAIVVAKKERKEEHTHAGRKHPSGIEKDEKETSSKKEVSPIRRFFRRKSV